MNYYASRLKVKKRSDAKVINDIISYINIKSINSSDRDYRRILAGVIKKLYNIKNIDHLKKGAKTDFTSENNPKSKRLNQTTPNRK